MPTVVRQDGFAFRIYPNDHDPVHVHVVKAGHLLKIDISTPTPRLMSDYNGLNKKDIHKALELAAQFREELIDAWNHFN